jgi:hypothetical protein
MRRVHILVGRKFKLSVDVETSCANLIVDEGALFYDDELQRCLDIDGDELKEIATFLDEVVRLREAGDQS